MYSCVFMYIDLEIKLQLEMLCMCTQVCVRLFATPCVGTIVGFCLARLWEEGDRRVNEWRGFVDASAHGYHDGVGGWPHKLNNMLRTDHSATSRDDTHAAAQSTKAQVKSSHSDTFLTCDIWVTLTGSVHQWLIIWPSGRDGWCKQVGFLFQI